MFWIEQFIILRVYISPFFKNLFPDIVWIVFPWHLELQLTHPCFVLKGQILEHVSEKWVYAYSRVTSIFFVQTGHETTYASKDRAGSYRKTYWLGRYSFLLGFIMSKKNVRGCVMKFRLGYNITNLLVFWHFKTKKERVSTESINYLIWTHL